MEKALDLIKIKSETDVNNTHTLEQENIPFSFLILLYLSAVQGSYICLFPSD